MLNKNWKKTSKNNNKKSKPTKQNKTKTKRKKQEYKLDKINQTLSHVRIYTYKHLTKYIAITEIKYLIAFHKYIFKCR